MLFNIKIGSGLQLIYDHGSSSLDKIISIKYDSPHKEVLCLFAHNYVEKFNITATEKMVYRKFCPEECILYAGDILQTNETTLIASGTVFRSILIW